MIENALYILKSLLSLSLNSRVGQISPRMSCTKEGKILCQPGWKVKQLPKVDYFALILENSTRAQHVKAQFARQDVTAKTDSAGECLTPLRTVF